MLTRMLLPICREVDRRVQHIQTSLCPESEKRAPDGQRGQNIQGAFKLNVSLQASILMHHNPKFSAVLSLGNPNLVILMWTDRGPSNPIQETPNAISDILLSHVTTGNRGPTRIMAPVGRMNMLQLFLFILDVRSRRIGEKISHHASQTTLGFWEVSVACLID